MKLEDYIYTQNAINKALNVPSENKLDFALFASMFDAQLDVLREHMQCTDETPLSSFIEGIEQDTHHQFHLKALANDYKLAERLNEALIKQSLADYKLLQCAYSYPLSMHDDPRHINDEVLENCSMRTQQACKEHEFDSFHETQELSEEHPEWLFDIIEQTKTQFQTL